MLWLQYVIMVVNAFTDVEGLNEAASRLPYFLIALATWRLPMSTYEYVNKRSSNMTWKSKPSSRCEYFIGKIIYCCVATPLTISLSYKSVAVQLFSIRATSVQLLSGVTELFSLFPPFRMSSLFNSYARGRIHYTEVIYQQLWLEILKPCYE